VDRRALVPVARGAEPADLVFRNATIVDVFSHALHRADVAVSGGLVVGVGTYRGRSEVDLGGGCLVPGLVDAHIHLESSMIEPGQLAPLLLARGTTAVVCDPHEIANVMGVPGVEVLIEAARRTPLTLRVMLPSCVPATALEAAGATLTAADLRPLLGHPEVLGLGEVMNWDAVLGRSEAMWAKLELVGGRPIDGHCPMLTGADLCAYALSGAATDHECVSAAEAAEKIRLGMHIMLREGSASRNLLDLLPVVTAGTAHRCLLATDDRHLTDIVAEGHLDHLVRLCIGAGVDPATAVAMASFNTARCYGLKWRGAIAPGYVADLCIVDDLAEFRPREVYVAGRCVAREGRPLVEVEPLGTVVDTMARARTVEPERFRLSAPGPRRAARVIELLPGQLLTRARLETPATDRAGMVVVDPSQDLVKLAVVERHHGTGRLAVGLLRGLGLRAGALATSVAHDSHNIVVAGVTDADMSLAVNQVIRSGGGVIYAAGGRVAASVPLPLAGLMSSAAPDRMMRQLNRLTAALTEAGTRVPDPYMILSFLALPVIPELRLTDRGLVDVAGQRFVPLFI